MCCRLVLQSAEWIPNGAKAPGWKKSIARFSLAALSALLLLPAFADGAMTQRLIAKSFSLTQSNMQVEIWRDKVPELLSLQKEIQAGATPPKLEWDVFTTTFEANGAKLILSVINTDCGNTPVDYIRNCPARLAEVKDGAFHVLREWPLFPIAAERGVSGYDGSTNASAKFMTLVKYDPATQQITSALVSDGEKTPFGLPGGTP
jgi:hypothetical protein